MLEVLKDSLVRLFLAEALVAGFALVSSAETRQASEDQSSADAHQQSAAQSSQTDAQMPSANSEPQTQDSHSFSGRVVKENDHLVLKDPVTKMSYQFDESKAKQYVGKQVKVTGKLDLNSNTIHIESIEPQS
jgi:hypothetical protein